MAVIKLPKSLAKVCEAKPIMEGWYTMKIVAEPVLKTSSKGLPMLELTMRVQSNDPVIHGRKFYKYLMLPVDGDANNVSERTGQTIEDEKMELIKDHALAFDPEMELADEIDLQVGYEADFRITIDKDGKNEIPFKCVPVPAGESKGKAGIDNLY